MLKSNTIKQNIPKGWEKKQIKDLLDYERPDNYIVKSDSYTDTAKTPVLTANKSFILGHTDEDFGICNNLPAVIFDDFTTDSKYVDFPFKVKSSAIKILRSKSKDVNLKFVFELIKSIHFQATNHKRYYISEYQDIDVIVPPPDEQKKIAEILTTIDEDIKKTDEIISKTEKLKNGLLRNLFSEGLDEVRQTLDLVCSSITAGGDLPENYIKDKTATKDFPYPIYSNGINEKSLYGFSDGYKINDDAVTISARGTIGYHTIREAKFTPIIRLIALIPNKDIISIDYLNYALDIVRIEHSGGGIPQLTVPEVKRLKIPVPSLDKQKKITAVLLVTDEKISANKRIEEKLILLKKGLIQDLLNGKVRV